MFELDDESQAALDDFCSGLSESQAAYLKDRIREVCADPAGKRQPGHRLTRPFRNPEPFAGKLPPELKVVEFKTNRYRALFYVAQVSKGGVTHRRLTLLPVKTKGSSKQRIYHASDAPWSH